MSLLCDLLRIFTKAEKLLEGDKYPSAGLVMYVVLTTRADLLKFRSSSNNADIKRKVNAAMEDLDLRFCTVLTGAYVPTFALGAILDPRFKSLSFFI